ncbi:iron-containing alcohol dehydrogenase [Bacteroidota bacterium]
MKNIVLNYPKRLVIGLNSLDQMAEDFVALGLLRFFIITVPYIIDRFNPVFDYLKSKGILINVDISEDREPTFSDFEKVISNAKEFKADCVAGIGGGSIMDVAKIVAALLYTETKIKDVVGNGLLKKRQTHLICIPTTSGTGSEVSPNSILLDENDRLKKGIISPYLVPDSVYVDPVLTTSLPPEITAYTGIDALTHCIEAFVNKNSHPYIDNIALEGINLISHNLKKAFNNGDDLEARSKLALGSIYGGMCLGPVNTAAVHALAYPLGSEFNIPHGLSNALLLPYVMEFNLEADIKRYAKIALTMGAKKGETEYKTALNGILHVKKLINDCKLPSKLSAIGIPSNAINRMAKSAMNINRLLKNNIREITLNDAINIYKSAY